MLSNQVSNSIHKQTNKYNGPLLLLFVNLEPGGNNNYIFGIKSLINIKIKIKELHKQWNIPVLKLSIKLRGIYPTCLALSINCRENHLTTIFTTEREAPDICTICNGNHKGNDKRISYILITKTSKKRRPNATSSNQQPPTTFVHLNVQSNTQYAQSYSNIIVNDTTQNKTTDAPSAKMLSTILYKFKFDNNSLIAMFSKTD